MNLHSIGIPIVAAFTLHVNFMSDPTVSVLLAEANVPYEIVKEMDEVSLNEEGPQLWFNKNDCRNDAYIPRRLILSFS